MAEIYVKLDDVLAKKQFSYDLKQYAVTEKDIRKAAKIEYVPDDNVEKLEEAARALFNRCIAWSKGQICLWCGMKDICEKTRSIHKPKEVQDGN